MTTHLLIGNILDTNPQLINNKQLMKTENLLLVKRTTKSIKDVLNVLRETLVNQVRTYHHKK